MNNDIVFEDILAILRKSKRVALFTHSRPDGDALGSVVALKKALEKIGIEVEAFCDTEIGHKFSLFFGYDKFFSAEPQGAFDLYLALDCADADRIGELKGLFLKQTNTASIDHHFSHVKFSKISYVVDCSSTCELIYGVIKSLGIEIDKEIATALFVGLSTDTGHFSHSNTSRKVFEIAAELSDRGVDIDEICDVLYDVSRFERTKLLGMVLSRIRRYFQGRLGLIYITKDDLLKTQTKRDDTEGFIDYAVNVEGALIGISLLEHKENVYKVSMRSKGLDVSKVCAYFGGGGHVQAAGCMVSGLFEDVVEKVLKAVRDILWTDLSIY